MPLKKSQSQADLKKPKVVLKKPKKSGSKSFLKSDWQKRKPSFKFLGSKGGGSSTEDSKVETSSGSKANSKDSVNMDKEENYERKRLVNEWLLGADSSDSTKTIGSIIRVRKCERFGIE